MLWAQRVAQVARDRKGQDVVILDMHDVTLIADYFVIITGHNTIHVSSLADHVEDMMKNHGVSLFQRVGRERSQWILLDYSDVVVHIFTEEQRAYYNLERLWGDASVVPLEA